MHLEFEGFLERSRVLLGRQKKRPPFNGRFFVRNAAVTAFYIGFLLALRAIWQRYYGFGPLLSNAEQCLKFYMACVGNNIACRYIYGERDRDSKNPGFWKRMYHFFRMVHFETEAFLEQFRWRVGLSRKRVPVDARLWTQKALMIVFLLTFVRWIGLEWKETHGYCPILCNLKDARFCLAGALVGVLSSYWLLGG